LSYSGLWDHCSKLLHEHWKFVSERLCFERKVGIWLWWHVCQHWITIFYFCYLC